MGSNADYRPAMVPLPLRLAEANWTMVCAGLALPDAAYSGRGGGDRPGEKPRHWRPTMVQLPPRRAKVKWIVNV
jgi:hypothetical protein